MTLKTCFGGWRMTSHCDALTFADAVQTVQPLDTARLEIGDAVKRIKASALGILTKQDPVARTFNAVSCWGVERIFQKAEEIESALILLEFVSKQQAGGGA